MKRSLQPDLLDWEPPAAVQRFDEQSVRAVTIAGKVCRAVAQTLKESALSRQEIARRMSAYLGEDVSVNMLNAYASEARETHVINTVRFIALLHATGDRRLLEIVAEIFGWVVIEKKFLPLIELAAIHDQQERLKQRADMTRRLAKSEGAL